MAGALLARTSFVSHPTQNNKSSVVSVTPRRRSVAARAQLANESVTTSNSTNGGFEEGELERPAWTGDEPLSRFVSSLIEIKPLFNVMKIGARQVLIRTAEKNGISWTGMSKELLTSDVYAEKELVEDKNVVYPDYYLKEFHAYSEGNLSWKAASEVAPATLSMMLRAIPTAQSAAEANKVLRDGWLQAIGDHHQMHSNGLGVSTVLDVGCSIGDSTRALADWFPGAHITGLDLSPYFLAAAQYMEKQKAAQGLGREKPITWLHANGECTGLPASSVDIISHAFVIHECPQHAIRGLLKEAYRLLRPGGTVALTDNSPKSKVIQNLPPAIFTLMKSTEPWMDEYYTFDLEGEMEPGSGKGGLHSIQLIVLPRVDNVPLQSSFPLPSAITVNQLFASPIVYDIGRVLKGTRGRGEPARGPELGFSETVLQILTTLQEFTERQVESWCGCMLSVDDV